MTRTVLPCPLAPDKQEQYNLTRKVDLARERFSVGSSWVFRDGRRFTEARVRQVAQPKGPVRVQVDLQDDHYVGERRWVPTTALTAPWDCREDWLEHESAWRAVDGRERIDMDTQLALSWLSMHGRLEEAFGATRSDHLGVTLISDIDEVLSVTGLALEDLEQEPAFYTTTGLVVPWAATERIAIALATVDDGRIAQAAIDDLRRPKTPREEEESERSSERLRELMGWPQLTMEQMADRTPWQEDVVPIIRGWMGHRATLSDALQAARDGEARMKSLLIRALGELEPTRTQKCARLTDEIRSALGLPQPPWKRSGR